jgi:hypothetical protein
MMQIAKSDRLLLHAPEKLGRSDAIPMLATECEFKEIFIDLATEEIYKFVRHQRPRFYSSKSKVQGGHEVNHHLVPERMTFVEFLTGFWIPVDG